MAWRAGLIASVALLIVQCALMVLVVFGFDSTAEAKALANASLVVMLFQPLASESRWCRR